MFNICYGCGLNRPDKVIDPEGPYAICPECGHRHPFRQLPLLILCGPSGAGKSTVGQHLLGRLSEVVVLEADILWRPEFNRPQEKYQTFFETWLRLCKNISQAGKPVLLLSSGAIPQNVEPCVERRYFSTVHYLALVCDDDRLAARLRQRPIWRKGGETAYIERHIEFNRWFKARDVEAEPPIALLDTTGVPVTETAAQVAAWVRERIGGGGG